jgi:SAM-dependent methyltransferase
MTNAQRRFVFNSYAELYDRARPAYPTKMFADLQTAGVISSESNVLEIGAGSGQVTLDLAPLVGSVTALEPGERLATLARQRLSDFPSVVIVTSTLEDFAPPAHLFDAIVAGTSFHWVDPKVRFSRCAALLHSGGAIAVFWNLWDDQTRAPFSQFADLYGDLAPSLGTHRMPSGSTPEPEGEPGRELFEQWEHRDYYWELDYQAAAFTDMLATHSAYRMIPNQERQSLLEAMKLRIDTELGGTIVLPYVTVMRFARLRVTSDTAPT